MTDGKRQYTTSSAECVALLHRDLHGVSEVVVYGDVARGNIGKHVQLLIVVNEEALFENFLRHLEQHRALYKDDMSENMCKLAAGGMLWNEVWPSDRTYLKCVESIEHIDITVVPFNWQDRIAELHKYFGISGLSRMYAYPVA